MRNTRHFIIKLILLTFIGVFSSTAIFASPKTMTSNQGKLAILIPSCDKYSDLWPPFAQLLLKYWPELNSKYPDLNIYLTSNQLQFVDTRIRNIIISHDRSWSDSLRVALEQIEEDYVLLLLDDYFINTPVADQKFWDAFAVMLQNDAAYLQVGYSVQDVDPFAFYGNNIVRKMPNAKFRTSLQAAVWHKATLLDLLISGESPWRFEIDGSIRSQSIAKQFLAIAQETPFNYLNAVSYGIVEAKVLNYLKEHEGIDLTTAKLKLPKSNAWKYRIKPYKKYLFLGVVLPFLTLMLLRLGTKLTTLRTTSVTRFGGVIIFTSMFSTILIAHRYLPLAYDFFLQYKFQLLFITLCGLLIDIFKRNKNETSVSKDRLITLISLYLFCGIGIIAQLSQFTTASQVCFCVIPTLLTFLIFNRKTIRMHLGSTGIALMVYVIAAISIYKDPTHGSLPISLWIILTSPLWLYFGLNKMRAAAAR